ncbi:MAG: hypothetical protein JRH13_09480 [Deltaproteobacteria bacterium]|nr:hypothetical protein [Deltaproteobacteria bacterium]MBW2129581.1 hypothetical protein [Deltaproteobacteria bacterium]MBW2303427.1 hypothetical protein [Deltaproteobacteria bacterium]
MTRQISFTKHENRVLPGFREMMNKAESTEDLKKFFVYSAKDLLEGVFEGRLDFNYEDFELTLDKEPYYRLSDRLLAQDTFNSVWNDSDLPRVMSRLAESAVRHMRRMEKRPDKCETKIRV